MEKMKIYLDTNTVIDFFINAVKSIKNKEEIKLPRKYQFFASKTKELEFMTSILSKNEIIRELIAGFGLSEDEVLKLWNGFIKSLNCRYIHEVKIDENLTKITLKFKMKLRTLINFAHLFVVIEQGAYFLTGDKDLVKIVKENKIYDKIITYPELRKMLI